MTFEATGAKVTLAPPIIRNLLRKAHTFEQKINTDTMSTIYSHELLLYKDQCITSHNNSLLNYPKLFHQSNYMRKKPK